MFPRRLVRASSERQLAVDLNGTTVAGTDLPPPLEKTRLLSYAKSTAVTYINGNNVIHHRILPSGGSNTVFPCASSVSLTLMRYPSSPLTDTFHSVDEPTVLQPAGKRKRRLQRTDRRSQNSADAELTLSRDETTLSNLPAKAEKSVISGCVRASGWRDFNERLRINVSGQYFETQLEILNRHPETLLGNREKRKQFFDRKKNELFFDRHRPSFEAIFSYYQYGGRLKRPLQVPDDVFLEEVLFYQLETEAVEEYKRSEGYTTNVVHLPSNSWMRTVWMLFEYPETSRSAFVIAIFSVCITLISIVLFCVETLPVFSMSHCVADEAPNFLDPFFIIETFCTAWFTLEALVRFVTCPNKLAFWKDFKNLVDIMAILPYYVTLFNVLSTMSCEGAKSSASLAFLRVIRLIRIFKLTKHSVGLQVLIMTFKASLEGLGLFLVALCVCLLVFSSAIYYAELGIKDTQIHSIPDAFWWAIITMTTVGYGDKVPVGNLGKVVGAACAITGVLTLAIPVPIITGHFNRFYAHKTGRGRHI